MRAGLTAALVAVGTLACSSPSWAYCRATTCDPRSGLCERNSQQCLTTGTPLFWASSCVQVYVQADGSPPQGISFETAKASVSRAFSAWTSANCGGAAPLLDVQVLGPISCGTAEYNPTQKNANIVVFRNDEWPYVGGEDALGFTHLTFNADTGELWDADIEINAVAEPFSVGDPVTGADLDSVLTHEAGHLLGLAHTLVKDATMFASYTTGTSTLRTLADDDVTAVCAAYAPDRTPGRASCAPRHGFSDACGVDQPANSATAEGTDEDVGASGSTGDTSTSKGCALAAPPAAPSWPGPIATLFGLVAVWRWRRRASRHQFVSCGRAGLQG